MSYYFSRLITNLDCFDHKNSNWKISQAIVGRTGRSSKVSAPLKLWGRFSEKNNARSTIDRSQVNVALVIIKHF